MAANDDIVQKITDLQGRVNGILPQYEQAKEAVDTLQKQLDALIQLGKLNKPQTQQFQAINGTPSSPGLLAQAQETVKQMQKPAEAAQKAQTSVDELMRLLHGRLPNMGPQTAQNYAQVKTDFLAGNDPQANEAFKKFVGGLQTVHSENVRGDLRKWVQGQIKAGVQVTTAAFAEQQSRLAQGDTLEPDENPQLKRQLAQAKANGLQRLGMNFRDHMRGGGYTSLGYDALALGEGGVRVADTYLDGRRYTQEARQRAFYGLLPGFGGLAGTVAGSFVGNPIAGGMIGAAIGTGADGILSAKSERTEAVRLAAEDISLQMGRGTTAAGKFADIIDETARRLGVPAQELAQSSAMIARSVTGFGPGGVNLQATLAKNMGDNYAQFAGSQAAYAATPFTRPYRDMLAGSAAPSSDLYGDAAFYFAFTGDQDNMKKSLGQKAAIPSAANPAANLAYQGDVRTATTGLSPWEAFKGTLSAMMGHPYTPAVQGRLDAGDRARAYQATHAATIATAQKAQEDDATFYGRVLEDSRRGRETFAYGSARYAAPRIGAEMSQMSGRGLAGLEAFAPAQLAALSTEQSGLTMQAALLQKRLTDKTLTGDRRTGVQLLLAGISGQLAGVRQQQLEVPVALFRQGVAEEGARFEGGYSRLGIGAEELTLGGASAFDPRVRANLAQRRSFLSGQSAYDMGLASDMTNYLNPMEREQRRTAAKQERFESDFALPNQYALQRIGETQARSGERQAGLRGDVARAQVAGGALATLVAENRLIADQGRLRAELNQRLMEGHLTLGQQLQVTTQIRDLDAQIVTGRKQAFDTAVQTYGDTASARASVGATKSARETYLRGTSDTSYGLAAGGYQAAMQHVATLKFAADTETNPDRKAQRQDAYQSALFGAEQAHIGEASSVSMGPKFDTAYTVVSHELSRQMKSAFAPGSVLQSNARLGKMDQEKIGAIDAQMARVQNDPAYSDAEKAKVRASLTEQREQAKDDLLDRQNTVDVGWIDRLTAMSVNAPSFSARLMPGSDRIADIAELRGLGKMSSRVFGYRQRSSYVAAETMGYLPSESNRAVFGNRPGDYPMGQGPNALPQSAYAGRGVYAGIGDAAGGVDRNGVASGGFYASTALRLRSSADPGPYGGAGYAGAGGMTLDRIDAGGTGAGVGLQAAQMMLQAAQLILQAAGNGTTVHVHQINPDTGQKAVHTQNSQGIYSAKDIMRGGAVPGHGGAY